MSQSRSILKTVLINFLNSLKLKGMYGDLVGKDHLGIEYYEKINQTSRRPSRWFVPPQKSDVYEIPIEWEAWLRFKRKIPPTQDEIFLNMQRREQVLENVRKQEAPKTIRKDDIETFEKPPFPSYPEYEDNPGKDVYSKKQ